MSTIKVDTYQTRGGASEIAIDKLKGVTAAGSMLVVGEGGTNTTNLQQGLCKAFLTAGSDTTLLDSLNVSSGTDNGTGDYSYALSNAFSNAFYSDNYTVFTTASRIATKNDSRDSSSVLATEVFDGSSNSDHAHLGSAHGDLA